MTDISGLVYDRMQAGEALTIEDLCAMWADARRAESVLAHGDSLAMRYRVLDGAGWMHRGKQPRCGVNRWGLAVGLWYARIATRATTKKAGPA